MSTTPRLTDSIERGITTVEEILQVVGDIVDFNQRKSEARSAQPAGQH